jgi:hypothetical protein
MLSIQPLKTVNAANEPGEIKEGMLSLNVSVYTTFCEVTVTTQWLFQYKKPCEVINKE